MRRRPLRRRPGLRVPRRVQPLGPLGRVRLDPVPPRARQVLNRAHNALASGDFSEAARIFHRLADELSQRGMPVRAAGLTLEAAYAEARQGKAGQAVEHARQAFALSSAGPIPQRIVPVVERLVGALRESGHEAEAAEVEKMLDAALEAAGTTRQEMAAHLSTVRGQRRGQLPAKCSSCAGPVLPDEVDWHDSDTAECCYCGSMIKAA